MPDEPASNLDALRQRAEAIEGRYQFRFGDKPRASRDLGEMDLLVKDARALLGDIEEAGGPGELADLARTRVELYQRERAAIAEAVAAGPEHVEAAHLGARANFVIARYHRNFAGHDRRTRDLALLDEIITDLEAIQREMARVLARLDIAELRSDLEVTTENLDVYRREREAIAAAQRSGAPDERASLLARLANGQFKVYADHFAGRARLTRRAGLLERVIDALGRILDEMRALGTDGFDVPAHQRNIAMVEERMALYRDELGHVEAASRAATVFALRDALASDLDRIMATYNEHFAGQDRVTRDETQLEVLCDQLGEVERQLTRLAERYDLDPIEARLGLVRDTVAMFEHEYRHVQDAKLN